MLTLFRRCEPAVGVPPVRGKTLTAIGFLSGLICPSPALSVWAGSYGKAGSLPPGSSNQTSGPVGFIISVFPMTASAVFCALLQNPLCRFPAAAAASEGSDSCAAVLSGLFPSDPAGPDQDRRIIRLLSSYFAAQINCHRLSCHDVLRSKTRRAAKLSLIYLATTFEALASNSLCR